MFLSGCVHVFEEEAAKKCSRKTVNMIKPGSSLLRFSNQSVKLSKNGHKPNWIHHPQVLQGGHVVYLVKVSLPVYQLCIVFV